MVKNARIINPKVHSDNDTSITDQKIQVTMATNRLTSAVQKKMGSEELTAFALNTWAENIENGEETAFIKTLDGKARINTRLLHLKN
jgi:hypothetical protein